MSACVHELLLEDPSYRGLQSLPEIKVAHHRFKAVDPCLLFPSDTCRFSQIHMMCFAVADVAVAADGAGTGRFGDSEIGFERHDCSEQQWILNTG